MKLAFSSVPKPPWQVPMNLTLGNWRGILHRGLTLESGMNLQITLISRLDAPLKKVFWLIHVVSLILFQGKMAKYKGVRTYEYIL